MDHTHRKMGIIDSESGSIKFVSRDEGYRNLRESAKRMALHIPVAAVKKEIEVKKKSCA